MAVQRCSETRLNPASSWLQSAEPLENVVLSRGEGQPPREVHPGAHQAAAHRSVAVTSRGNHTGPASPAVSACTPRPGSKGTGRLAVFGVLLGVCDSGLPLQAPLPARNQRRPTAAVLPRETPFSHGDPHLARPEGSGAGGRDGTRDATLRDARAVRCWVAT